jgi:hypothetical protein
MKTLLKRLLAGCCLAIAAAGPGAAAERPVALPNPGFEEGELLPIGWTISQSPGNYTVFAWSRAARTGKRCLYIRNEGLGRPVAAAWISERVPLKGGTRYRFSAWLRKKAAGSATALRVRGAYLEDGVRRVWETAGKSLSASCDEWTRVDFEFETPPPITGAAFWLSNVLGRGDELWFDDLELVELDAE